MNQDGELKIYQGSGRERLTRTKNLSRWQTRSTAKERNLRPNGLQLGGKEDNHYQLIKPR